MGHNAAAGRDQFPGTTIVMATHNKDIVNTMRKRVIAIERGQIVRDQMRGNTVMNFSTLLRHLREGFKNVFRNGWMSVASVMSIIVSLLILGVFMLLVLNVNSMANQVDSQVEISTFLELNVDENLRNTIGQEISAMPEVSEIRIVPKDEGLKEFRERLGENADNVLGGFDVDNNPLPDTIEVKVIEPETVNFVAQKIEALNEKHPEKPIMKVNYGKETVDVLFKFTKLVRNIGFIFVGDWV